MCAAGITAGNRGGGAKVVTVPYPETLAEFDGYWAKFLGCTLEDLRGPRTVVVPHGTGLAGRNGICALRHGHACVVSVPPPMVQPLAPLADRHPPREFFDRHFLHSTLRHLVGYVAGPAWVGVADKGDFRQADLSGVVVLTPAHRAAEKDLMQSCDPADWHQSSAVRPAVTVGRFGGNELVAAAWYDVRGGRFAFPRAVVRPSARRQGHGRAVASGACAHALSRGMLLAWQALTANAGAVALGPALGFQPYGQLFLVSLRAMP
jgi:GNAT superfamily N-acetyltransferase